jgi:alanine racemase
MSATTQQSIKPGDEAAIPPDARAVLRIDLKALRHNWAVLNAATGNAECAGVIKAEAYGLGLEQVAHALIEEGCRTFFVATIEEGRRTRVVEPGAVIYVLDGLLRGSETYFSGFDLRPVLSSLGEIEEWGTFCNHLGRRLPAALHIDTGINRLGLSEADVRRLAARPELLCRFHLKLVLSHLACADEADNPMNEEQRRRFDRLRAMLPDVPASLANSGGIFLSPAYHYDLVRPGIALYGGRVLHDRPNPMKPVVQLSARILQVRDLAPGETVGYGAVFRTDRTARVATVACGYADGFLRALSGSPDKPGPVGYIGDYQVPVVGRVSMDLLSVDVSSVPEHLARRGDWVEVIGDRVTIDDLTDMAGTIGYELLARLSRRVHRVFEDD